MTHLYRPCLLLVIALLGMVLYVPSLMAAGDPVRIVAMGYVQEDRGQPLTPDEAVQLMDGDRAVTFRRPVLNFGIDAVPVWLRLRLENTADAVLARQLIIADPWLDTVDVWLRYRGENRWQGRAGDRWPFARRREDHRFLVFPLELAPGISDVYVRVETPDPMLLPLRLVDAVEAHELETLQDYSYGFVYGFIIALALYNAILFLSLGFTRYLYYAVYLLCFIAMNIAYTGHGFKWLWPAATDWQQWAIPLLMTLYGLAGLLFASDFLQTVRNLPRVHRVLVIACGLFVALQLVAVVAGSQVASLYLAFLFVVLFTLAMVYLGITAVRAGLRSARYFLYASLFAMAGALLTAVAVLGLIPYTDWAFRAVEIGMLVESVLLAMALADHMRLSQEERLKAERLSRIDLLTGLNNRRGFYETARPLWVNAQRYGRDAALILLDIDHFKRVNDTHGHMLGDKVLVLVADYLSHAAREGDVVARWGGEEFILFLPETSQAQALLFAERLRESIASLDILLNQSTIHITVSLGVSCRGADDGTLDDLITRADRFLYRAKDSGRNRTCGDMAEVLA